MNIRCLAFLMLALTTSGCGDDAREPADTVKKSKKKSAKKSATVNPGKAVERGRVLFSGKGNCALCHTIDGADKKMRGPDLAGIGRLAKKRAAQFGLKGKQAGTRYLTRAIVRPGADRVKGYNPMPESWLPSRLNDAEIRDLVLYLQSLGRKADPAAVSLPTQWLAAKRQDFERELALFAFGDPKKGRLLFNDPKGDAGCVKCHKIDGVGQTICPDLSTVQRVQRPSYILESILNSSAFLVRGYRQLMIWDKRGRIHVGLPVKEDDRTITLVVDDQGKTRVVRKDRIDEKRFSEVSRMPGNFAQLLRTEQLFDLVAYLLQHESLAPPARPRAKGQSPKTGSKPPKPGSKPAQLKPTTAPSLAVFGPPSKDRKRYRKALQQGDPAIGRRLYSRYCVACHGASGDGKGFNAANLETKPADHTDNRRMSKTGDRLLHGVISRGGNNTGRSVLMPPWGKTLTQRQIWDLVAYLRGLHASVGNSGN